MSFSSHSNFEMTQSLITTTQSTLTVCTGCYMKFLPTYWMSKHTTCIRDSTAYYWNSLYWNFVCTGTAALAATENSNDRQNSPLAFYTGTQQFLEIYFIARHHWLLMKHHLDCL